jgi:hypothetical protein
VALRAPRDLHLRSDRRTPLAGRRAAPCDGRAADLRLRWAAGGVL